MSLTFLPDQDQTHRIKCKRIWICSTWWKWRQTRVHQLNTKIEWVAPNWWLVQILPLGKNYIREGSMHSKLENCGGHLQKQVDDICYEFNGHSTDGERSCVKSGLLCGNTLNISLAAMCKPSLLTFWMGKKLQKKKTHSFRFFDNFISEF